MVLTDGTTTVTIQYSDDKISPIIEKTTKRTAGANVRQITGGERLTITSRVRVTPAKYRELIDLLTNNADNYFFTPEDSTLSWWADLYPNLTFPVNGSITNVIREWDNRDYWYVTFNIETTSYT